MFHATEKAKVGPMASVAGAISEYVGKSILKFSDEVIIENGGDIYLSVKKRRKIGIFSGINNIYNQLAIVVTPDKTPLGICSSSGSFGHSLSLGTSKVTIVIAKSAILADAYATALGNMVFDEKSAENVIAYAESISCISGVIIITENSLFAGGDVQFELLDK